MSTVMTNSAVPSRPNATPRTAATIPIPAPTSTRSFSTADEIPPFRERLLHLVYGFIFCLAFFVLFEMAQTRSLESQTVHFLPAADLPVPYAERAAAAGDCNPDTN
jgi:hypothetical protein